MTKEEIYDAEIAPLMAGIIAACERGGIACFCTFDITPPEGSPEDAGFLVTTHLTDGDGDYPPEVAQHVRVHEGYVRA